MPTFKETVEFFDVEVERESALAIYVHIDGEYHWIPKSQISDESEVYCKGDEGILVISEFIAKEKGLI